MSLFHRSAILALCILGILPGRVHGNTQARCTRVVDGDTLLLEYDGEKQKIHLEGIDAPELDQKQGQEARDFLSGLALGKDLEFTILDPVAQPPVARLELDGKNISLEVLAAGLAWIGKTENEDFALASIMARSSRRGLWAESKPIPPWIWRNRKPTPTPRPTPPPTIRSLSEMASRTELEKNKEGKTVIEGLPQMKPEKEKSAGEKASTEKRIHVDFSCPVEGLADCAEAQFKTSYEKAAGKAPKALVRSPQDSEDGGHLFTFTGEGFSIPVACQCPEAEACACSIDISIQEEDAEEPLKEEAAEPVETEKPEADSTEY